MVTEAEVRAALDGVIHPSFGLSLNALGMVRAVQVSAAGVAVDLVMNCPGCPGGQSALALARQVLGRLSGGDVVKITLLPKKWGSPWEEPDAA
jgi:metal-sulfur cluster biosynthetic enzyme